MAIIRPELKDMLVEGDIFHDFKELCAELNFKYYCKATNSGEAILKQLQQFCDMEFEGQKIIITKVYDEPRPIIDGRTNFARDPSYCLPKEYDDKAGVYKITNPGNKIYIGSARNLRRRWYQHKFDKDGKLEDGGKYELLELVEDLSQLHIREQYYIDLYKSENMINQRRAKQAPKIIREKVIKPPKNKKPKYKTIKVLATQYDLVMDFIKNLNETERKVV